MMENDISWHLFEYEPPPFFETLLLKAEEQLYFGWWSSKQMCFFGWTQDDYYAAAHTHRIGLARRIKNVVAWAEIPEDYNRL
jgi:hypothetical protein